MRAWVAVLTMMHVILVFTFSAGAQGSPPPYPFLPYADLLSKQQALVAVENQKFACQYVLQEVSQKCSMRPKDRFFSEISLTVIGGVPESVVFKVINDSIQVGDLVLLWGRPDMRAFQYIFWPERNGVTMSATVTPADRLNYLAPVWEVSFNL